MKRLSILLVFVLLSIGGVYGQYVPAAENLAARRDFEGFRFGIFLHWGIYSEFAQGEWYLNSGKLKHEEYQKAASCFYPVRFNADEWVRAIRASGAKYITFTSRHHDGFSMWQTKESPYNIVDATPFKRDVVRELAVACKKQHIRLHLYYSILDWMREDYPLGRTGHDTGRELRPDYESYFQFMKRQMRELICDYDGVEGIWLDGYWDHDSDSIPFDWRMKEFYEYIHSLKPACLIGNNHHVSPIDGEDFQMFERDLPGENTAGLSGQDISQLPLEMCQTMNGMWGYKVADQDYKSSRDLITLLVRAASKGSNLLLNIGPQPNGELPTAALERLHDIGQWMQCHGESVYGTTRGEEYSWGVTTKKGPLTYLHVLEPVTEISLPLDGVPARMPANARYDQQKKMLIIAPVSQYDVITIEPAVTGPSSRRVVFSPEAVPYRIPALARTLTGDLIAVSDYRYCKADIGNGAIDLRARVSRDGGMTWEQETVLADGDDSLTGNDWRYAYGDPCIVADATSHEVVLFCVGGHVGFFESTRENPQHVVRFHSFDDGRTWDGGTCITEAIYGLYDHREAGPPAGIFLTSGRILQSRHVKVGDYYRLYIAHPIRKGGAAVIYSDDLGKSWQVLGSPDSLPSSYCDESVVEEMPDGRVLLSVREKGCRFINVYTYTDVRTGAGSWGKEQTAVGIDDVNACNGELLLVPAVRKRDGKAVHVLLHSLPQSKDRVNVGFYYKEIASPADYASVSAAAAHWQRGLQVSQTSSCYSTMLLDKEAVVLLYEENGRDGGYDIVSQRFSLEEITGGAYGYLNPATLAEGKTRKPVVVAYVTAGSNEVPDPTVMTHINYAFGVVNETFDGVTIQRPDRLRMIAALKQVNPHLKVMLSIGGWTAGRFSEMAATKENREAFARDCRRIVDEYGLDGIDMDWEYPTSSEAGISSSPEDTDNFTLLMQELRRVLGKQRLLTAATVCTAKYIDFRRCLKYMDFINVMSYDMSDPNRQHHAALYPSPISGYCTASQAVEAHLKAGVPKSKLVMGMPFYQKGRRQDPGVDSYLRTGVLPEGYRKCWSDEAQASYIANAQGEFVWAFEDVRSLTAKCQYILDHNLLGAMYWDYISDKTGDFRNTVCRMIMQPK